MLTLRNPGRRQVYIAVMGVTGAGKSTFIRTASDLEGVDVGHDLKSCTTDVFPYSFHHGTYEITLIDTPGFNDTLRGETEVLKDIADWLDITYRNPPKIKLSGIIYMQALTDRRMYGSTLRNLKMFRQLCGDEPLKNVVFTTTGWGVTKAAGNFDQAVANEEQLKSDPDFWQPMIKRGSQIARFEDTKESAIQIIMSLVDNDPVVLKIQKELVDEDKNLVDTAAGATVNEEIKKLEEKYKKELADMQEEIKEALASKDEELKEALMEAKTNIERLRENNRRAYDSLNYERRNTDRRHENEMQSLKNELENQKVASERDKQVMAAEMQMRTQMQRYEDKMQFEQMVAEMRANSDKVRAEERQALEERIREIQKQRIKSGRSKALLMALLPTIGKVAIAALGFPLTGTSPFGGFMTDIEDDMTGYDDGGPQGGYNQNGAYNPDYGSTGSMGDPPAYTEYEVEEAE